MDFSLNFQRKVWLEAKSKRFIHCHNNSGFNKINPKYWPLATVEVWFRTWS